MCYAFSSSVSYELSHITYVWKNDEDTLRKSPSLTTLNAYLIQNATTTCPIKASWRGNFLNKTHSKTSYYIAHISTRLHQMKTNDGISVLFLGILRAWECVRVFGFFTLKCDNIVKFMFWHWWMNVSFSVSVSVKKLMWWCESMNLIRAYCFVTDTHHSKTA